MGEEDILVRDGDHVIVERAGGDRFLGLLDEQGPLGIEAVEAGDGLGGLQMLPRRKGAARHAIDEQFQSGLAVARRQPHVISRAFVAERGRDGIVDAEMLRIRERDPQLRQRARPFVAPVRHGAQVRDRQVAAAVASVGGRGDRRRIGRPHRRCGHCGGRQCRLAILERRAERREPFAVRTALRARRCPAPNPARGWRASCRGPAERRRGAATPDRHSWSRRGCRSSARHNCATAR